MMVTSANSFATKDSYYSSKNSDNLQVGTYQDQALKDMLFQLISKKHKVLGYKGARRYLFGDIHLDKDNSGYFVNDVYCNIQFRASDFSKNKSIGPMKIPDNNKLNCEHTWPQSKFTKNFAREMQKSDLHHLYPTESKANGKRGNYPFAETTGRTLKNCSDSSFGSDINSSSGSYFQPPVEHRGNVARALFYFSVRYRLKIDQKQETYLKKWHNADPVDQDEIARNNRIEEVQFNRNPFIDYPSLVASISDF